MAVEDAVCVLAGVNLADLRPVGVEVGRIDRGSEAGLIGLFGRGGVGGGVGGDEVVEGFLGHRQLDRRTGVLIVVHEVFHPAGVVLVGGGRAELLLGGGFGQGGQQLAPVALLHRLDVDKAVADVLVVLLHQVDQLRGLHILRGALRGQLEDVLDQLVKVVEVDAAAEGDFPAAFDRLDVGDDRRVAVGVGVVFQQLLRPVDQVVLGGVGDAEGIEEVVPGVEDILPDRTIVIAGLGVDGAGTGVAGGVVEDLGEGLICPALRKPLGGDGAGEGGIVEVVVEVDDPVFDLLLQDGVGVLNVDGIQGVVAAVGEDDVCVISVFLGDFDGVGGDIVEVGLLGVADEVEGGGRGDIAR